MFNLFSNFVLNAGTKLAMHDCPTTGEIRRKSHRYSRCRDRFREIVTSDSWPGFDWVSQGVYHTGLLRPFDDAVLCSPGISLWPLVLLRTAREETRRLAGCWLTRAIAVAGAYIHARGVAFSQNSLPGS